MNIFGLFRGLFKSTARARGMADDLTEIVPDLGREFRDNLNRIRTVKFTDATGGTQVVRYNYAQAMSELKNSQKEVEKQKKELGDVLRKLVNYCCDDRQNGIYDIRKSPNITSINELKRKFNLLASSYKDNIKGLNDDIASFNKEYNPYRQEIEPLDTYIDVYRLAGLGWYKRQTFWVYGDYLPSIVAFFTALSASVAGVFGNKNVSSS